MFGNSSARRTRLCALCSRPLRNHRSCVGPQSVRSSGPAGKEVAGEEAGEGRGDVPGAGGEVDDGCAGVRAHEPLVEHAHPRHRPARVLVEHEGVPRGQQRARQGGHHDGVVDVGDDPEPHVGVDDEDRCLDRLGVFGAQGDGVPAGRELGLEHLIDHPAAIRADGLLDPADLHGDRDVVDRNAREAAPSADLLVPACRRSHPGLASSTRQSTRVQPGAPYPVYGNDDRSESALARALLPEARAWSPRCVPRSG